MKIETALAKGATSRTELRDPETLPHLHQSQLKELSPSFSWPVYWKAIGVGHFDTLNVATPDFFKAMNAEIEPSLSMPGRPISAGI
jgi:putative endopeptidase